MPVVDNTIIADKHGIVVRFAVNKTEKKETK